MTSPGPSSSTISSTSLRTLGDIFSWIAKLVYPHRARLEEARITTCFNNYHDLMVAARIGKKGYIRQIAGYNTNENDTRIRYVSWQSSKSSGERPSTETHKRLKIWQEQGWRWHACVFIMLDRMLQMHLVSLVNVWPLWLSSVPVFKLTWSQVMGTRHAVSPRQRHQGFPHTSIAYCNTGSTRWWMLQHKLDARTMIDLVHLFGWHISSLAVIGILIF